MAAERKTEIDDDIIIDATQEKTTLCRKIIYQIRTY